MPFKPSRSRRCLTAFSQTLAVADAIAICSMSFGDVLLRLYSCPSMIHLSSPFSCHPSSLSVAMTTATGPR
eukprot:14227798-Heterocapsa_arctica.AAC.1